MINCKIHYQVNVYEFDGRGHCTSCVNLRRKLNSMETTKKKQPHHTIARNLLRKI